MKKVYYWSYFLDLVLQEPHLVISQDGDNWINFLDYELEKILKEDYYKYLGIYIVRHGKPMFHQYIKDFNGIVNPYNIIEYDQPLTNSDVDIAIRVLKDKHRYFLSYEYQLWSSLKSEFKKCGLIFVEEPTLLEEDIFNYFKNNASVELAEECKNFSSNYFEDLNVLCNPSKMKLSNSYLDLMLTQN